MLSAQTNYHLASSKDSSAATVEFVSNMLQSEATNYLTNMGLTHGLTKMCSTLTSHWPNGPQMPPMGSQSQMQMHHHQQQQQQQQQSQHTPQSAAAAAALAAGHNIESILGSSYSVKIDPVSQDKYHKQQQMHQQQPQMPMSNGLNLNYAYMSHHGSHGNHGNHGNHSHKLDNSYDVDSSEEKITQ